MSFLPIAERELRLSARRRLTYYSRSLAALVAFSISLALLFAGFAGLIPPNEAGRVLFWALSVIAGVFIVFECVFATADSISQEKRDGTLGLLFLTDLKGYDVAVGKLISTTSRCAYCLVAALPALGISFLLGGVTGGEFVQVLLALLNLLFFTATLGLLVSTISRRERRAAAGAFAAVLFFCGLLPGTGIAISAQANLAGIPVASVVFTPIGPFLAALGFPPVTNLFWWSLGVSHLMGWGFLIAASFWLPRAWKDKVVRAGERSGGGAGLSGTVSRAKRSMGRRDAYSASGGRTVAVMAASAVVAGLLFRQAGAPVLGVPLALTVVGLSHVILKFAVAAEASRSFFEERRSGALELLLTTPLGDENILRERMLALKRRFLPPLGWVLFVDVAAALVAIRETDLWEGVGWTAAIAGLFVILLLNLYCLAWVGAWMGLKCKSTGQATRRTLLLVLVLPLLGIVSVVVAAGVAAGGWLQPEMFFPIALIFIGLGVMCNIGFCGWAMSELKDDLRRLAGACV